MGAALHQDVDRPWGRRQLHHVYRNGFVRSYPGGCTRIPLGKEGIRMGVEVSTTRLEDAVNWGRKNSFFSYPFVTACCGMEFMWSSAPKSDLWRLCAEFPRFSPRQSDLMMIVGTITEKQAPALRGVYDQMAEPKWVIAFGVCASTGGFYQNYGTVPGADQIVPVDVYIPGCPPRPEQVLDAIILLQERVQKNAGISQVAYRREQQLEAAEKAKGFSPTPANSLLPANGAK